MKNPLIFLVAVLVAGCLPAQRLTADSIVREHLAEVKDVKFRVIGRALALKPAIEGLDVLELENKINSHIADALVGSPILVKNDSRNKLFVTVRHRASPKHSSVAVLVEMVLYQPALLQIEAAEVESAPIGVITWLDSGLSLVEAERAEEAILELVRVLSERFLSEVRTAIIVQNRNTE